MKADRIDGFTRLHGFLARRLGSPKKIWPIMIPKCDCVTP